MSAADKAAFQALLAADPALSTAWADFCVELTAAGDAIKRGEQPNTAGLQQATSRVFDAADTNR